MNPPPVVLLENLISASYMYRRRPEYALPGSVVSRMSSTSREVLADLRSAHIATLRADVVRDYLPEPCPSRQLKLSFDALTARHFRHY